jgi:hypothetical protein
VPDDTEEMRLKNAILEHQACCPQQKRITACEDRLRQLNGIDKTVAHHEDTLYGDDRGLFARVKNMEDDMETTKPVVQQLRDAHLKSGVVVAVAVTLFSVLGFIGFERLMRAISAMAAVPGK